LPGWVAAQLGAPSGAFDFAARRPASTAFAFAPPRTTLAAFASAPIDQTVAGDDVGLTRLPSGVLVCHDFLPSKDLRRSEHLQDGEEQTYKLRALFPTPCATVSLKVKQIDRAQKIIRRAAQKRRLSAHAGSGHPLGCPAIVSMTWHSAIRPPRSGQVSA
jgi:hypothetical protein